MEDRSINKAGETVCLLYREAETEGRAGSDCRLYPGSTGLTREQGGEVPALYSVGLVGKWWNGPDSTRFLAASQ